MYIDYREIQKYLNDSRIQNKDLSEQAKISQARSEVLYISLKQIWLLYNINRYIEYNLQGFGKELTRTVFVVIQLGKNAWGKLIRKYQ